MKGCLAGDDGERTRELAPIAGVACGLTEGPGAWGTSGRQDSAGLLPDRGERKESSSPRRRLFESTVAGIAALPDEVVRRLVGFCTL